MGYGLLISGWVVYFVLHSLLATISLKQLARQWLGSGFRFYRLAYSIFSTFALVVLIYYAGSIPAEYFFSPSGVLRVVSIALITTGVMLIQVSFRQYNLGGFLGLRPEEILLRREGILKLIRHPIYSGLFLVTIGYSLFIPNLPTLVSCLCILGYLPVGIILEERKLILEYGEAYLEYKREVPALIPKWSRLTGH